MEGKLLSACLVTYYDGNGDFIPYHYDETRAHGTIKLIAAVSLGSVRPFQFRRRLDADGTCAPEIEASDDNPLSYDVPPGSLLIMAGNLQDHFMHQIPPMENKSEDNRRISLTLRSIVPDFEDDLERRGLHETFACHDDGKSSS
jgi:alkylated DNA repair dioxygenase AlkB